MNTLAIAQGLGALMQIATDAGLNYVKIMQVFEQARSEGREPSESELRSAIESMHEAGRDARGRVG
jgi:hypothetical protein